MIKVLFQPDNVVVEVEAQTTILQAANKAGLQLNATCGGKGTCGKCLVRVLKGDYLLKDDTILCKTGKLPACQAIVLSDIEVEIPQESKLTKHKVLIQSENVLAEEKLDILAGYEFNPLVKRYEVTVPEPTLTENATDLNRLMIELTKHVNCSDIKVSLPVLRKLAHALRDGNWNVSVDVAHINGCGEIIDILPGKSEEPLYGLAIDIGTTTVVVFLIDLLNGKIIDKRGTYNKQAKYGDDVISRMIHADEENDGLKELQQAVLNSINELISEISKNHPSIHSDFVKIAVCAGNTTMTHLLLALDPKYIRLEPYIPTAAQFPAVKIKDMGLPLYGEGWVVNIPSIASYVGGDIVAGALAVGIEKSEELTLFIDIGTNGEMVLGNKEWLVSCACSAGPAFEGGGITFGMRAMRGAIERIQIDQNFEVSFETIENDKAVGICGSGLIDGLSKLHSSGIIDRTGKFQTDIPTDRLRQGDDGPEFVLVWAKESGINKDIIITESDIKNLLRAKGAIFAGIRSMLDLVALEMGLIDKVLIAGGFGNYLNLDDSIKIGLLPDLDRTKYQFVGNTSVKGAQAVLLSTNAYHQSIELSKKMTYLELSVGNTFMEEFVSATFIPHTDLTLFPSLITKE
ncbi:MAG: ferredoxin [Clostridiaceae bacterium BRH_c20a]|nr:MAG: ferredoxin [Clostridiaceae bacterium BRH_c20a]